ncbi:MAG: gamma-glutamyl-gamma-aminobutyrate hydrolase family protein [Longimicrobiales bacterium]
MHVQPHPRPVIGVTTQTLQAIDNIPANLPHSWVMNERYVSALAAVGAAPVLIPLLSDDDVLRAVFDSLDGVFIPGGVDMDPATYGCKKDSLCGTIDIPRDRVELLFAKWAVAEGKPVFGVCRGMQVLNVAAGGTLHQDTTAYFPNAIKHDYFPTAGFARDYLAHDAAVAPGTRLHAMVGADSIRINSMHHQGVDRLGSGLIVSATASDGLIEALEGGGDAYVVGVQWHPEMLIDSDPAARALFRTFVEAAGSDSRVPAFR